MKKIYSLIISILFLVSLAKAQDIHFSQFYAVPIALNAANTGNIDGKFRLTANYRSEQYVVTTPYKSSIISADFSFLKNKKNFLGAGLTLFHEKSGDGGFESKKAYGSLAYHIHFGNAGTPKHYLHIGVQVGLVNTSIYYYRLVFDSQYDPATGTYSNFSNEQFHANPKTNYFDWNAGAIWSSVFSKKASLTLGVNFMHFNPQLPLSNHDFFWIKPDVLTTVFHAIAHLKATEAITFSPAVLLIQMPQLYVFKFGSSINCSFKSMAVYGGLYYQQNVTSISIGEGMPILMTGIQFKKIRLGIGYDFNIPSLRKAANSRGAFELSLAYCPFKSNRQIKFYPKD